MRAGAQSAAAAIGVTIVTIRHMGGYSPGSKVPETTYIDPSCPPTPAAVSFFGWLRPNPKLPFDATLFLFGNVNALSRQGVGSTE
jgi:hypothetical protein